MDSNTEPNHCDSCGTAVPCYDGIYLSGEHSRRFLCSKCYNETMAEAAGLDFDHLSFHPITLADTEGMNHTFHFQTRLFGDNVLIRAMEIRGDGPRGYEFSIVGDADEDLFALFTKLIERLRRELSRKHIEPSDFTRYGITNDDIVRGRITWDDDTGGEVPLLVIDGKELSWDEFGRMLMTYEGFHFKIEIFEGSEER